MAVDLLKLGISFNEPALVEKYYADMKAIFVKAVMEPTPKGLFLNLDALPMKPYDFKEIFIKWLVSINLSRIRRGEDPVCELAVILKCPIWKIIPPPLKRIDLTKQGLFNKPGQKTVSQKATPRGINK